MNLAITHIQIIEIGAVLLMALGVFLAFKNREKGSKGLGKLFVQLIAVILILPIVLILALEGKLPEASIATIIGAFVGYVLSDIGSSKPKSDD